MGLAYIRHMEVQGTPLELVEIITLSPGDPPERPHPIPPIDPDAPRPSHPIALPGDPWWGQDLKPTHPIALPGDPWWPKPPETGEPPAGTVAVVRPMPEGAETPVSSPDAAWMQIMIADGKPTHALVNPYAAPVKKTK